MPHPSAGNAYPRHSTDYPSYGDVLVTDTMLFPSSTTYPGAATTPGLSSPGIALTDTATGSRTGAPTAAATLSLLYADTATGSRTGPSTFLLVNPLTDGAPGQSRSGAPVEVVAPGGNLADRPYGHRTGSPGFGTVNQVTTVDTATGSRTGRLTQAVDPNLVIVVPPPVVLPAPPPTGQITIFDWPYPDVDLYSGFYPGRTVPFGTIVPRPIVPPEARPPRYRLFATNTVTGILAYELPFTSVSWSQSLNSIGSLTATLQVERCQQALSDQDERDPKAWMQRFLASPYLYSLNLTYGDNVVVWAGPYTPASIPGDSSTVQVAGTEFIGMWTRRLLIRGDAAVPSFDSDVYIGPTSKPDLAHQIVRYGTYPIPSSDTSRRRELPWVCSDPPPKSGSESRLYYGYDLRSVWDGLSELAAEVDGPDFRFDPYWKAYGGGWFVEHDLHIGRPLLAQFHEWGWDSPQTASVAWDTNTQNLASTYYASGSGQDRAKLIAKATDDTLPYAGYPPMELADTLHSSEIQQSALQAKVNADLYVYSKPSVHWTVRVQASGNPQLGSYRPGDSFQISIHDHPVIPDGTYTRRITSLSGNGSDWVDIGSADNYVVTGTTSSGVQIVTS